MWLFCQLKDSSVATEGSGLSPEMTLRHSVRRQGTHEPRAQLNIADPTWKRQEGDKN